jgi:acyl-CoA synthetase (AMP-forming)/AMP-acid ligase II
MNLTMLLEMAASGFGERVAVQNGARALTYSELFRAAGRAAQTIEASGVERVAMLDVSSLAVPVALFASAWSGRPFVPLNYRLTQDEVERLASQIAPALLVTDAERAPQLSKIPGIEVVVRDEWLAHAVSEEADAARDANWPMDPEDIAILLFTSGTTGAPKAAVLRHKHIVSYILGSVEFMGAAEQDAALMSVPPYHVAGMAAIASSVYSGRRVVQLPNFKAADWFALARRERITNAFVVPTMLSRIIEEMEARLAAGERVELPDLRAVSYGGGKMPLPVIEKAMHLFPNTDFTNAYGLTETSSTISVLTPDDHREAACSEDPAVRRRLVSVGRPLPMLEVRVCDEQGRPLPPGERGEICVRGEQVSGEYLGRGSLLSGDGWFATRDGGSMDAEGYLFVEGRIDDVIVRGGENLSPGEIEDVLLEHPAVSDAAVIGVPDEQWGEAVAAAVVLKSGASASEAELQQWVKDRLRSSRVPRQIGFRAELPYNETGKLLRRQVRAELAASAAR